jgi:hypothetical protein
VANPIQLISTDPTINFGTGAIIDGISDMFRIVASGILTTPNVSGLPAKGAISVVLGTGISYLPVNFFLLESSDGIGNTVELCPNQTISNAGAIAYVYEGWCRSDLAGTTTVIAQTFATTAGAGSTDNVYRYYILSQIGV